MYLLWDKHRTLLSSWNKRLLFKWKRAQKVTSCDLSLQLWGIRRNKPLSQYPRPPLYWLNDWSKIFSTSLCAWAQNPQHCTGCQVKAILIPPGWMVVVEMETLVNSSLKISVLDEVRSNYERKPTHTTMLNTEIFYFSFGRKVGIKII